MNKSVKANIVAQAISAKFKGEYEKALRSVTVAARKFAIANSKHTEFMALKLPVEMMRCVSSYSEYGVNDRIRSDIDFIANVSYIYFDDIVYARSGGSHLRDEQLPELAELRKLVKVIEREHSELSAVVNSYTTAKKLVADLPWTEQYLPTASKCTGLIAIDVINDINAKFGK